MAVKISGIPSFWGSNGAEHLGEDGLLLEQCGEARNEQQELVLRHGRDEFVEHDPLAEQRVGAPLGLGSRSQGTRLRFSSRNQAFAEGGCKRGRVEDRRGGGSLPVGCW